MISRTVLQVICILTLLGTLSAGIWPFHAPINGVVWLREAGLGFGKHGSVLTAEPFSPRGATETRGCSLEVWLEPALVNRAGTILTFYQPNSFAVLLALRQSLGDLVIGYEDYDHTQHARQNRIYADDVFREKRPVLITMTSGSLGTKIYSNSVPVKQSSRLKLSAQALAGKLIIGNAPSTTDSWSGQLLGLAIYDSELTKAEVAEHDVSWTQHTLGPTSHAVALYLFDEGQGIVAHNQIDPVTNLSIPDHFVVPNKQFLEPPWDEFHGGWSYWKNVAGNIFGFAPLGFFFCSLFYSSQSIRRPLLSVIVLGFAVSLTIEVLQGFLPTRDSGMTDLFTNTFGTALGAFAFLRASALWRGMREARVSRPASAA